MISKRLKTIANLVDSNQIVADIGCDHGYLSIYLIKNKLCKKVIASDINENALNQAKKNINKYKLEKQITLILSDGLTNLKKYNITLAIIAGMGTTTILNIVANSPQKIEKYIISSNNNYDVLRMKMHEFGYNLENEIVVLDHDKYYPIMVFQLKKGKINKKTINIGLYNQDNKEYYRYLKDKKLHILNKIPKKNIKKRWNIKKDIKFINDYLNR